MNCIRFGTGANELTYLPIGATPGVSATSLLGNDDGGMAVASLIFPFYNGVATSAFVRNC